MGEFYAPHGDLFVRITNMSRDVISLDLSDACFVKLPAITHEGERTQLCVDDVLVSVTADIGIISHIDHSVPLPAYINQHIALVRLPRDVIDPMFAAYFLARGPGQKTFRAITDQGAKAGINLQTVRSVPVVAPPTLDEQRTIAKALSDVDVLLAGLDRLIAKKRDLKQAAMQQLLTGQKRLEGFKEKWTTRRLKELGEVKTGPFGSALHERDYVPNGTPIITVEHLGEFGVVTYEPSACLGHGRHAARSVQA